MPKNCHAGPMFPPNTALPLQPGYGASSPVFPDYELAPTTLKRHVEDMNDPHRTMDLVRPHVETVTRAVESRVAALEAKSEQDPMFGAWKTDVLPRLLAGKADSSVEGRVDALERKSEQDPQFGAWKTDVLPGLLSGKADSSVEGRVDALERKSEQDPMFGAWKTDVLPRLLAGKADAALVDAKVDEFTPWMFDGDSGDWSIVFRREEPEGAPPEGVWFADLLKGGELVHSVAVESQFVTSVSFRWGEDGMVDATRRRVLRTGDAVSSVNGQTGAVALTAETIPYNDDGDTIEEAVNGLAQTTVPHLGNFDNPHGVTAKQVGAYTTGEVDGRLAAKADELTPWVPAGTVGHDYPPDLKDQPTFSDGVWRWVSEDFGEFRTGAGQTVDSVSITLQSAESETAIFTATRKRVLRTGDADKLTDAQKAVLGELRMEDHQLYSDRGFSSSGMSIDASGVEFANGGLEYDEDEETGLGKLNIRMPEGVKVNGKEVATEEQVDAVSDKVDAFSESVSTDNRFLVNGTTAAIQTRESEDAEWANEIRIDKGYDALQGNTMVKLDKSVQTVTVAGSNLVIEIPDSVDGTVRDLCVYANNSSSTDTALTFPAGTYYGDNPNGAVAKAGKVTAIYLTEIPKGAWMLRIAELDQHEVTA